MIEPFFSIQEALEALDKKKVSALELTQACFDRIKKYNAKLNVFLSTSEDEALKQAKKEDVEPRTKPLQGIPIALKDLYLTKDIPTTAASKVLFDYLPQYDATVVKRLQNAGAIVLGKVNQDAWGHGVSGENSDFGPTLNPWNKEYVAGGSSSGSGAAVASGMAMAAGGTDTGGSVRCPASFCNVVGLKPTYGRVSRYGIIAMASSLDSIGHITRTVWDNARYLEVTAGKDPYDATTCDTGVPNYTLCLNNCHKKIKGLKIGLPKEYFVKGVHEEVKAAVKKAARVWETEGAALVEVDLPHSDYGVATYYIIQPSEVSSNLARYDGIRYGRSRRFFGPEAKRRIMLGTYTLSSGYYEAYYKKAMQVRTLIKKDFEKAFEKVDLLVGPVFPSPAFRLGAKKSILEMYMSDIFTCPINLAGLPALALPCGFSKENLPIGMQIIGPQFSESLLFQVGHYYQQMTDWHKRRPRL